ncbi:MAG: alkaline shock response membrane anchor protein AmaP, partial [Pseudonocardiaceae bacterium]
MSSRSQAAVTRSAGTDRTVTTLLGLLALAGGAAMLLVGSGVLGTGRAGRPLVDPLAVDWVTANRPLALGIAIGTGLLLLVLGLTWALRSVRPERKPDVVLDRSPVTGLTVTSGALADA